MLTYRDCLDMSELTEDDVELIARYFGLSNLAALCLGQALMQHGHRAESICSVFNAGLVSTRRR